jgi:hypothetical protein
MPTRPARRIGKGIILWLLVLSSSIGAWFLPDQIVGLVFLLLLIALAVDAFSFLYHLVGILTGWSSFTVAEVALLFYAWFWLAYRKPLCYPHETSVAGIIVGKLGDLLLLAMSHQLFQAPYLLRQLVAARRAAAQNATSEGRVEAP